MASLPNSVLISRKRRTISSSASFQLVRCQTRVPFVAGPFGYAPHGIKHTIRRVNPVEIFCYLGAEKSARHRMGRVALDLGRAPVPYRNQHSAGVGAIVRTGSMDNLLHRLQLYAMI